MAQQHAGEIQAAAACASPPAASSPLNSSAVAAVGPDASKGAAGAQRGGQLPQEVVQGLPTPCSKGVNANLRWADVSLCVAVGEQSWPPSAPESADILASQASSLGCLSSVAGAPSLTAPATACSPPTATQPAAEMHFAAAVNAALASVGAPAAAAKAPSRRDGAGPRRDADTFPEIIVRPAERPPEPEPMALVEGSRVEYFSKSNGCWIPVRVVSVDPETGAATLDVKPNAPLSLAEQLSLLRPRTQPGREQLDWVRRVLRDGRIEQEAELLFGRHARLIGAVPLVLFEDALAVGAELDAKIGSSGAACCVQQYVEDAEGCGITLAVFREMFWELLWGVQNESGQALHHKAVSTLPQSGKDFAEAYELGRKLGSGTYGTVRMATDKKSGAQHAVKLISKEQMLEHTGLDAEVDRLAELDHPNIVKLYGHYEDSDRVYLVMDFCSGGELQSVIYESCDAGYYLREGFVACVMNQVLMAISHVHSRGILHLDLKPANVLLMPKRKTLPPGRNAAGYTLCELGELPHVMVIDLGVAQVFRPGVFARRGPLGTPATMAPEAWRGEFNPKSDVFSAGVMLFELLTLQLPFDCPCDARESLVYWAGRPQVPWNLARHCSSDAAGMCCAMLALDRRRRPEARQCLQAPFLVHHRTLAAASESGSAPGEGQDGAGALGPVARSAPKEGSRVAAAARARLARQLASAPARSLLHSSVALSIACAWPANQLPTVERLFQELDVAGSGLLHPSRIRSFLEAHGVATARACEAAEAMDLNRDEGVDWTEFVAACIDLGSGIFDQDLEKAFEDADEDDDGLLSQQDFSKLLAGRRVRGGGVAAGAAADLFVDLTGHADDAARLDWSTFMAHFRSLSAEACPAGGSASAAGSRPSASADPRLQPERLLSQASGALQDTAEEVRRLWSRILTSGDEPPRPQRLP